MENKLIIVLALMMSTANSGEWYTKNDPLVIDYTNEKQLILEDKLHIKVIKYFTPWCNYCRYLKPAFDQLKQKYQNSQLFKFYQVNCERTPQLCEIAHITTYPSLLFINGNTQIVESIIGYDPPQEFKILVQKILMSLKPKILKEENPKKDSAKGNAIEKPAKVETPLIPAQKEESGASLKQQQISEKKQEKTSKQLFGWIMHFQSFSQMLAYCFISVVGWAYFKSVVSDKENEKEVKRSPSNVKSLQIWQEKQQGWSHENTIVKVISV